MKIPVLLCALFITTSCNAAPVSLEKIKLAQGFNISLYATVPKARSLSQSPSGTIFIGTIENGKVYAVTSDKKVITIASDLDMPNGVAYYQGKLYIAERTRIIVIDDIENNLAKPKKARVIYKDLPTASSHGWRYLRIGPDKKLYVSVGAPCNVCTEHDTKYATIMRMNLDGSDVEIYVKGVRNSLGFTWHPKTKAFWFSDNGRDWLGDDLPPDELNVVHDAGLDYGFPLCYGKNIPDKAFDKNASCDNKIPSAFDLPAHVAALGMTFYTGEQFPKNYKNDLFIAYHGSWNRSQLVGYKIARFKTTGDEVTAAGDFAVGWNDGGDILGRPVDLLVYKDGSLIVSDDKAGVLYRIAYHKQ